MKSPVKLFLHVFLLLVCLGPSVVWAQQGKFPAYVGHVNDFANVIDPGVEQQLETILTNFEKMTGTQIAAVTIQSLNERPIEDYAVDLYRAWGIGQKSGENKDKGALLMIALQDRKTRLEVGYGLEGDLPDGLAGEIIRRMRPALQQQQYGQGINIGVRTLVDTLAQKWNVNIEGIEDRSYAYSAPQRGQLSGKTLAVMVGLFIFFIILMAIISRASGRGGRGGGGGSRGDNLWWAYPIIFNQGGGSFGGGSSDSGGWGGGGGGDWGGFGGGSSGGGGASDSW
jgi:uncharacterized protein